MRQFLSLKAWGIWDCREVPATHNSCDLNLDLHFCCDTYEPLGLSLPVLYAWLYYSNTDKSRIASHFSLRLRSPVLHLPLLYLCSQTLECPPTFLHILSSVHSATTVLRNCSLPDFSTSCCCHIIISILLLVISDTVSTHIIESHFPEIHFPEMKKT